MAKKLKKHKVVVKVSRGRFEVVAEEVRSPDKDLFTEIAEFRRRLAEHGA